MRASPSAAQAAPASRDTQRGAGRAGQAPREHFQAFGDAGSPSLRSPAALLWLFGVSVLALLVRVLPFSSRVFTPRGVELYGDTDPYYHLRRIEAVARAFPSVPDFDAWMGHPSGAHCIWSPLFDFVPGAFAFVTGIEPARVAVAWPPVLGALGVAALFAFAYQAFGLIAAVIAGSFYALLPAALMAGALGHVDHHVAELLFQIAIFDRLARDLGVLLAPPAPGPAPAPGKPRDRPRGLGLGAWMGAALLTWAGSVIFLALPALVLAVAVWKARDHARSLASYALIAFAVAAAIALPYGLLSLTRGRAAMSPNFLSLLQPSVCLLLGAAPAALAFVLDGARSHGPKQAARRLLLLSLVPLLALSIPSLREGLLSGLSFLGRKQSGWLEQISEFRPLFTSLPVLQGAMEGVGYGFFLLPLAGALGLLLELRTERSSGARLVLSLWALHAFVLGVLQLRFVEYAAAPIALLPVWLYALARGVRWPTGVSRALPLLPLLLAYPVHAFYAPWTRGRDLPFAQLTPPVARFFDDIRRVTPSAGDSRKLAASASYGVLAPWELGHWILVRSERAVVANNFGDHLEGGGYEDSERFFFGGLGERESIALMERRKCRYALSRLVAANPEAPKSFIQRLHASDATDTDDAKGSGRFRLVLEARGPKLAGKAPYKLYELVRGAVVSVPASALAGERKLEAMARVRVGKRRFTYRRELELDARSGRYETRVSYPGTYGLQLAGATVAKLRIDERQVIEGATLTLHPRTKPNAESPPAPATTGSEPAL